MVKRRAVWTESGHALVDLSGRLGALALAVLAIVGFRPSGAWAQEREASNSTDRLFDLSLKELLEIRITTASLRPQEVQEVPATTYVVTEEDFRVYGYRDLKDVLRNLPGIEYVYPHSHLFGGQRGFSSFWELTKLLVNGREVNSMFSNAPFIANQFSLTGVKRIEIVQGPASVLYGSEAFSGVINIITKDAENSPEESEITGIVGGGDKSSLDTNGSFHSVARRGELGLAVGGYLDGGRGPDYSDFVKTGEYSEVNRERRTYLLDHGNPYRDHDRNTKFNLDLAYSPGDRFHVKVGALYWRTEGGPAIEQPQLSYTNGEVINEQMHLYASGEYRFASVPVKSTLSYHFMLDNFWARSQSSEDTGDAPPLISAFNVEDSKLNVANLQVDCFPSVIDNYFLAGIGMRDTDLGEPASTGNGADTAPGQPYSMVGRYLFPPTGSFTFLRPYLHQTRIYLYAQDQQALWDKRIQITAGLRYDHSSIYGNVLNVRSGIFLRPLPNVTLRGSFGQGFREPRVVELFNGPDLVPARMNTWETSLLLTPARSLSAQVTYFQNRASKLILPVSTPDGYKPRNVGEKRVAGIETLIRYQVGPFGGDLWHSYEYPFDDQPLYGTARNKLGFGGHYSYREHWSLALRAKYTSRALGQALDADRHEVNISVPHFFTLDANLLARNFALAGASWDVAFSMSNILGLRNVYVNPFMPNPNSFLAEGREFFGRVTVRY